MNINSKFLKSARVRKILTLLCFIVPFFSLFAGYNDVHYQIFPTNVVTGEAAVLYLTSAAGFPELDKMPLVAGLKWSDEPPKHSTSRRVINARRLSSFSTVYQFTINKEGSVTIPAIKVKIGHLVKSVGPIRIKASKRKVVDSTGRQIDIDKLIYATAILKTNKSSVYVGEEIPLEIRMFSVNGLPVSLSSWPLIDIESIVMKDYSSINPQSSYFEPLQRTSVTQNGQIYNVNIFKAALRPIAPGSLVGKVVLPCIIKVPQERSTSSRRQNDPLSEFFSNSFFGARYKEVQYKVNVDIGPKKVLSLPVPPQDSYYTGLVGEWDLQYSLSSHNFKAGEPVTLKVMLKGKGTLDTLSAPEINIEGFRIYPPEIKKTPHVGVISKAEIDYAIIPKSAGDTKIDIAFSTFSPLRGKYIIKKFSKEFQIAKSDDSSSGMVADSAVYSASNSRRFNQENKKKMRTGILYLKPVKAGAVHIPLSTNNLFWILTMFILGPLTLLISEIFSYKKQKLSQDPLLKRKNSAKRKRSSVLKSIQAASNEDELHAIIQNDVTPLINDLCGYPPGTSTDELADKVADPNLSECLRSGSSSSYMPGNHKEFDTKSLKRYLLAAIKKVSIILITLSSFSLYATDSEFGKDDPRTAYDNGDSKKAEQIYKSQLDAKNPDPAWIYNIGNCAVQEGNFPKALVYYERARRLAPGDSDILENLNFVRRKLLLPEIGDSKTPIDSLENFRDCFRPDTWMLIIAVAWSLCWLSLACRRMLSNRKWASALIISSLLLILSILAYVSQQHYTYNQADAIVVKRGVPVYMLPSEQSGNAGFKLRAGEEVSIEEERHDWLRVREGHSEGWVKSDTVKRVWPY